VSFTACSSNRQTRSLLLYWFSCRTSYCCNATPNRHCHNLSSTNITDPSTQKLQAPLKSPNKPNLGSQSIKYLRCTGRHIRNAFYNISFVISSFVYKIIQDGKYAFLWNRVDSIWTYSSFRLTFSLKTISSPHLLILDESCVFWE